MKDFMIEKYIILMDVRSISACFSLYVKLFPSGNYSQMCKERFSNGYGEYLIGIQRQNQKKAHPRA